MSSNNQEKYFIKKVNNKISKEELINQLAKPLIDKGHVVADFPKYVLQRESEFPTGLATQPVGVAIPHTDHSHVIKNGISIGVLSEPIQFSDMGGDEDSIPVRIVFMLAFNASNKQLNILGVIMKIIQDSDFLCEVINADDSEIYHLISNKLQEEGLTL